MTPTVDRTLPGWLLGMLLGAMGTDALAVERMTIGGEGLSWEKAASVDGEFAGIDMTGGTIAPMFLRPDQNIAPSWKDNDGFVNTTYGRASSEEAKRIFDGDPSTAFIMIILEARAPDRWRYFLQLDLGRYWPIDRIVFFPRPGFETRFLEYFHLQIATRADQRGYPVWETFRVETENRDITVVTEIPHQMVRYVRINPAIRPWEVTILPRPTVQQIPTRTWEIAEFQVFGSGYVPTATYISDIMDFEEMSSWGTIRWKGRRDPGAKIHISTRSGADDDPNIYSRKTGIGDEIVLTDTRGRILTRQTYEALEHGERGPITYDTENWSFWSAPYDFDAGLEGGVPIVSRGPRQFLQIKVEFVCTETDGGRVEEITFDLSKPPAASALIAEMWPLEVKPGEVVTFTYALRPTIRERDRGFDTLEIFTPIRAERIRSVSIGGAELSEEEYTAEIHEDRIVIWFPRLDAEATRRLIEVVFDAAVLRYGTEFVGYASDSETEEVPQLVSAGDATLLLPGDDLSVQTVLQEDLFVSAEAYPNPFTPNADGINDEVTITYQLLQLTEQVPVSVTVYDLAGRRVREVYRGEDKSGAFVRTWDGRNDAAELVPPGIYVYRISVEADGGSQYRYGLVSLVY